MIAIIVIVRQMGFLGYLQQYEQITLKCHEVFCSLIWVILGGWVDESI